MSNIHYGRNRRLRPKSIWLVVLACLSIGWLFNMASSYPSAIESDDARQVQPTVGKVTMIYGNNSVYESALDTHKEHCRRLRYPLFVLRKPILDGVWNKYAILLSVLLQELEKPVDRRLQWLLWFDSDTVLMNANMPLETFLPPAHLPDVHMLLTKDWNGMNNGVFFIRVHKWSVELLTAATAYPVVNPDVELYWPDQSALNILFEENSYFAKSVVYCPLRWFNAYMRSPDGMALNPDSPPHLQVHPGDLLVHFPGTGQDHLGQTLGPYIAIAEEHRAEWEPPLESTNYIEETESFWKKQAPVVS